MESRRSSLLASKLYKIRLRVYGIRDFKWETVNDSSRELPAKASVLLQLECGEDRFRTRAVPIPNQELVSMKEECRFEYLRKDQEIVVKVISADNETVLGYSIIVVDIEGPHHLVVEAGAYHIANCGGGEFTASEKSLKRQVSLFKGRPRRRNSINGSTGDRIEIGRLEVELAFVPSAVSAVTFPEIIENSSLNDDNNTPQTINSNGYVRTGLSNNNDSSTTAESSSRQNAALNTKRSAKIPDNLLSEHRRENLALLHHSSSNSPQPNSVSVKQPNDRQSSPSLLHRMIKRTSSNGGGALKRFDSLHESLSLSRPQNNTSSTTTKLALDSQIKTTKPRILSTRPQTVSCLDETRLTVIGNQLGYSRDDIVSVCLFGMDLTQSVEYHHSGQLLVIVPHLTHQLLGWITLQQSLNASGLHNDQDLLKINRAKWEGDLVVKTSSGGTSAPFQISAHYESLLAARLPTTSAVRDDEGTHNQHQDQRKNVNLYSHRNSQSLDFLAKSELISNDEKDLEPATDLSSELQLLNAKPPPQKTIPDGQQDSKEREIENLKNYLGKVLGVVVERYPALLEEISRK